MRGEPYTPAASAAGAVAHHPSCVCVMRARVRLAVVRAEVWWQESLDERGMLIHSEFVAVTQVSPSGGRVRTRCPNVMASSAQVWAWRV